MHQPQETAETDVRHIHVRTGERWAWVNPGVGHRHSRGQIGLVIAGRRIEVFENLLGRVRRRWSVDMAMPVCSPALEVGFYPQSRVYRYAIRKKINTLRTTVMVKLVIPMTREE